jgi:cyclin-dependent kinase 8/11
MLAGYGKKSPTVAEKYRIIGFISSGTYGMVYKAQGRNTNGAESRIFAIKKYGPLSKHR